MQPACPPAAARCSCKGGGACERQQMRACLSSPAPLLRLPLALCAPLTGVLPCAPLALVGAPACTREGGKATATGQPGWWFGGSRGAWLFVLDPQPRAGGSAARLPNPAAPAAGASRSWHPPLWLPSAAPLRKTWGGGPGHEMRLQRMTSNEGMVCISCRLRKLPVQRRRAAVAAARPNPNLRRPHALTTSLPLLLRSQRAGSARGAPERARAGCRGCLQAAAGCWTAS